MPGRQPVSMQRALVEPLVRRLLGFALLVATAAISFVGVFATSMAEPFVADVDDCCEAEGAERALAGPASPDDRPGYHTSDGGERDNCCDGPCEACVCCAHPTAVLGSMWLMKRALSDLETPESLPPKGLISGEHDSMLRRPPIA